MEFVIDLILIAVFAAAIIFAYVKGFVKTLIDTFGFIVAGFSSLKLSGLIDTWIYDTFFKKGVVSAIEQNLASSESPEAIEQIKNLVSVFTRTGFDMSEISQKISEIDLTSVNAAEQLEQAAVQPILTTIIRCVLFLVLALILIVLLRIVSNMITKTIKDTALGGVNKFFGALIGVVKGLILVSLLIVLIVLLAAVIKNETFNSMVESSRIIGFFNTTIGIFKIN